MFSVRDVAVFRCLVGTICAMWVFAAAPVWGAKPWHSKALALPPTATVGVAYSFQFTFVDANNPGNGCPKPMTVTPITAAPPGLALTSQGLLHGTPTTAGSFAFKFTAQGPDINGPCGTPTTYDAALTVSAPITLSPTTLPSATAGVPYRQQFRASGGQGSFVFTHTGTLPTGLSLTSSGLLSGTPATEGSATFTVVATDLRGGTGTQTYTFGSAPPAAKVTKQFVQTQAVVAVTAPTQQLGNIFQFLDNMRMLHSPAVLEGLRIRINGQALPPPGSLVPKDDDDTKSAPRGGGGSADHDPFERWGMFVQGDIDVGKVDANGNQSGFDVQTNGLTIGTDYRFPGNHVIGAALGLVKANADINDNGGTQDVKGLSVSLFGEYVPAENAYIDLVINYGNNKYDGVRRAPDPAQPTTTYDYSSNPRGSQFGIALSAGYQFNHGSWLLTPYGRVEYIDAKVDAFEETATNGGPTPLQNVSAQRYQSTVLTAGGHAQYAWSQPWGVLVPYARLEYRYATHNSADTVTAQYVGGTLEPVLFPGADNSYGNFAVGVSTVWPQGLSGYFNYQYLFAKQNFSDSRYTLGVRYDF